MPRSRFAVVLVLVFAFAIAPARAQDKAQTQAPQAAAPAAPPAAKPADVSSPDAILAATYDVISGPAGQKRDWDRFRSLFLPGAILAAVSKGKDGALRAQVITPEQYIGFADTYFDKNGFFEREAARHADRFGDIMQIFSTYESRHDGKRWWVVSIYWEEESPDLPLPKEFLPAAP